MAETSNLLDSFGGVSGVVNETNCRCCRFPSPLEPGPSRRCLKMLSSGSATLTADFGKILQILLSPWQVVVKIVQSKPALLA